MQWIRLSWRLNAFVIHIGTGLLSALLLRIICGRYWYADAFGSRIRQRWMQILAQIIGLRINTAGKALQGSTVYVANHISWLDVVAISACTPTSFVAKSSLKNWPILGQVMWLSGTLFIERYNKRALVGTIKSLQAILTAGGSVSFFPESTTTAGNQVMEFRSALYAAATDQDHVAVQPIAIRYPVDTAGQASLAPFIGEDTFAAHLLRVLRAPAIPVQLSFCEPVSPRVSESQPVSRQFLATDSRRQIIEQLQLTPCPTTP